MSCPRCGHDSETALCLDCQRPVDQYTWRCEECLEEHEMAGRDAMDELRAERAELEAEVERLRARNAELEASCASWEAQALDGADDAVKEIEEQRQRTYAVAAERDEARAEVERLRVALAELERVRDVISIASGLDSSYTGDLAQHVGITMECLSARNRQVVRQFEENVRLREVLLRLVNRDIEPLPDHDDLSTPSLVVSAVAEMARKALWEKSDGA